MSMSESIEKAFMNFGMYVLLIIIYACWGLLWSVFLMWAWNYTIPTIFGLPTITYWQMFCLYFILSSLWKITVHKN